MNTKTDLFLEQLIKDASNDMEAPFSCTDISSPGTQEKKDMIRSLMNIRVPRALSTELLQRQDAYLQEELAEKGIVRLPEFRLSMNCNHAPTARTASAAPAAHL